jgi:tetratricopeptide (TPR) repeat protein
MNSEAALSRLEKQIAAASRSLEEERRNTYRDPARIGDLVESINVLAELRAQQGEFHKAESLYREALSRIQEVKSSDPELSVGVYSLLAYLYDRWGKLQEAADLYAKALELGRKLGVNSSEKIATIKNNLAMIHKGMRDFEGAAKYYKEALDGFRQLHGENSPQVASVYNNLGVLYYQNLDIDGALEMHMKALRLRENLSAAQLEAGDLSQSYTNLSAVYKAQGDFKKAHECIEKSRSLSNSSSREGASNRRRSAALLLDK